MKQIAIDLETTGLNPITDEILQIAIVDQNGKRVMNQYCIPLTMPSWEEAQKVNGITPEMVIDKPPFINVKSEVEQIIKAAETVVIYNYPFDSGFLASYGLLIDTRKVADPMLKFAELRGIWDDRYKRFKPAKLIECAAHFGYHFKAHDAEEDARAAMYVWRMMKEGKAW